MEQDGSTGRLAFTAKEPADSKVVLLTQGDASKTKIKASPFSPETGLDSNIHQTEKHCELVLPRHTAKPNRSNQ